MAINPYQQALERLRAIGGRAIPGSEFTPSDLTDPSAQLYALQEQRKSELDDPRFYGSPHLDQLKATLGQDLAESPITQQRTQLAQAAASDQQAQAEGFANSREKAAYQRKQAEQAAGAQQAEQLGRAAEARAQAAYTGASADIVKGLPKTPTGVTEAAPAPPSNDPYARTAVPKSQSFMSYLTGQGALPYNSASDMMDAAGERLKYNVGMATPFSPLAQEESYKNLEQLVAMFPGVRGFQYIIPLIKEHQDSWGHETPLSTYTRAVDLRRMLDTTSTELDSEASKFNLGPKGVTLKNDPAAIQRSKAAVGTTRAMTDNIINYMKQLYPGIHESMLKIGGPGLPTAPATATPSTPGRFQRIPD